MIVYGFNITPTTWMVLATLAEKRVVPTFVPVDIMKGEHKAPEHLARHPFGLIPVLEIDGRLLYEARAILRYLDRHLPGVSLTPADPWDYALMEQFLAIEQAYLSPNVLTGFYAFAGMRQTDEATLKAADQALGLALDVADEALSKRPFLAGDAFSLADIAWLSFIAMAVDIGKGGMLTARPHLDAWWKRTSSRPSWTELRRG